MILKKISLLLCLIFLISCSEENEYDINNISITTLGARDISEGGVILEGEINNVNKLLDYGFVISSKQNSPESIINKKYKTIAKKFNGQFQIEFRTELVKNKVYYYRAFFYIDNTYVFGKENSFVANGSAVPTILNIVPTIAHLNDTITLKGTYFSKTPEISFDEFDAEVLYSSDTLIRCIVPKLRHPNTNTKSFSNINLKNIWGKETTFIGFKMFKPTVDSIRPYNAYMSDTLTFYGKHFEIGLDENIITTEGSNSTLTYQVITSSRNKITVAPRGIYELNPKFKLSSQMQTIEVINKLKAAIPKITSINSSKECLYFGDTLVLYGKNIPTNNASWDARLAVELGGVYLTPFSYSRDSISFRIPNSPFNKVNNLKIDISFLGVPIENNNIFCIAEKWIKTSYKHTFEYYPAVFTHINNDTYMYAGQSTEDYVSKFNKETGTFDIISKSISNHWRKSVFVGSKLYLEGTIFQTYDIHTKEIEILEPSPKGLTLGGFIENVGDNIYMGLGTDNNTPKIAFPEIWKYNIPKNTWKKVLDFPGINEIRTAKLNPINFVIGDAIYIAAGETSRNTSDFWKLNTNTDQLTRLNDIPFQLRFYNLGRHTILNNKVYIHSNTDGFYVYDPTNDTWTNYPNTKDYSDRSHLFTVDNKIHSLRGGDSYKLNPNYFNL